MSVTLETKGSFLRPGTPVLPTAFARILLPSLLTGVSQGLVRSQGRRDSDWVSTFTHHPAVEVPI